MKKIIIIISILITWDLIADQVNPFDFNYTIEISYLPLNALWQFDQPEQSPIDFYTYLESEIDFFNIIFLGGGMQSFFAINKGTKYFKPFEMNFSFFTGIRFKNFEAGFRHYCIHPIITYMTQPVKINWEGGYEELYIKISSKTLN